MNSVILRTATQFLLVLLLLYSVFILLRGHNEPGGGFIGGLIAAGAFALYGIAYGSQDLSDLLRIDPRLMIGLGLLAAVLAGLLPMLITGQPFLTGLWYEFGAGAGAEAAAGAKVGSSLLFDIGVFLVVIGFTLTFVISLEEA